MGQRFLQLNSTYSVYQTNKTATLHVSQLPPNPAIIAPGPALIFVVVNGVPSIGLQVMLGSGTLGNQSVLPVAELPAQNLVSDPTPNGSAAQKDGHSSAYSLLMASPGHRWAGILLGLVPVAFLFLS